MAIFDNRICNNCGRIFEGGPRALFCPGCRLERQRKQNAEHKARARAGKSRKIGSIATCTMCHQAYAVSSGNQKYCPNCAPEAVAERDRVQGLEYYHKNKEFINPQRNELRRKAMEKCNECGLEFDPQGTPRKYCSEECNRRHRNREWNRKYGSSEMRRRDRETE